MANDGYYISMFHHKHGVDASVICGDAAAYWSACDGYDKDNADEYLTEAPLLPLFAAAPEMLEVLHLCNNRWDSCDEESDPHLGQRLRDVLAKATIQENDNADADAE